MKKTIKLTESQLNNLVKRVLKEQEGFDQLDDTPIEDEPSLEDDLGLNDDFEEISSDDYSFDISPEDTEYPDEFQRKMGLKDFMKRNKPSSGGPSRMEWRKEYESDIPWSPIKPSDMPLDKYLKSVESKKKRLKESEDNVISNALKYILGFKDSFDNFDLESFLGLKKSSPSSSNFGNLSDKDFYSKLLEQLGAPVTDENLKFLYAWRQSEGNAGKYNPFNTTLGMPGATNYNKVGVKNYRTLQDGFNATLKTLKNGRYNCIISGLRNNIGADKISTNCISDLKTWGTGDLVAKVVSGYDRGSTPKPSSLTA